MFALDAPTPRSAPAPAPTSPGSDSAPTAVIVGGGIAGLTAALALQRAGWIPEIHEARDAGAAITQGVFLTLAVNGQAALERVGAAEAFRRLGFPTGRIRFDSADGKPLGSVPIGPQREDGSGTRTVRRADLHRALHDLVATRGIPVVHGRRFTGAEPEVDGRLRVQFDDGSTATADLLVGADGLHSAVRPWIDPHAPVPRHAGIGNAGGFARVPADALAADPGLAAALEGGGDYRMLWGRKAFFGWTVAPDGEVWWFANPPSSGARSRQELAARSAAERRDEIAALFDGDRVPAARLVAHSTGDVLLEEGHDLPRLPHWWRGSAVLIGDAAHAVSPSTGQGASLAIEDAVTLAACVRDARTPDAIAAALADYEHQRRRRVERVAAWGRRIGNTKTGGPVKRWFIGLVMPRFLAAGSSPKAMAKQAWLFDHRVPDPAGSSRTPARTYS